ncbi:MAG: hypothetical protein WCA07_15315 [Gloeobacterales cyanobacterium]
MKKDLIYTLVLSLITTPYLYVEVAQADPDPKTQKADGQIMLRVIKAKPLQPKIFRANMITSPAQRFQQVADQVNRSNKPVPEKPVPTAITPIIDTVTDIQGRVLNLGTDVFAFTLSPLPIRLERPQVEYVRDRTFEAVTKHNVQFYKTQW